MTRKSSWRVSVAVGCDGDGCDIVFRRGPTVRARHVTPDGHASTAEVPTTSSDAVLTPRIESGRFLRRDPSGATIGAPVEIAPRDARTAVTWTGTRFLVASAWRRRATTKYSVIALTCDAAESP